jgi:glycosyltransferase involved in cell wall biosynthesis
MGKRILYIGNKLAGSGRTPTHIDTLTPLLEAEGHELRTASSEFNKLLRMKDMLLTIHKNREWAQVAIIDTYSTANFWFAIVAAKLLRKYDIPYIPILHGGNLPKRISSSKKTLDKFINGAMRVICPSGYLFDAFAKAGYKNLQIINNTIELDDYVFTQRNKLNPKLLWVRSFAQLYNPTMAVEVAAKLKEEYPDVSLCMVGPDKDGSLEQTKVLADELKVDLKTTGKLPKKEWHELSKQYDVFINTTHFDNLPVSLLEAMALGLPVVSTDVGGIPHLIDNNSNGILVSDADVNAMVEAIDSLLSKSDFAQQVIARAHQKIEEYSWNVVKEQWNELLSSVG